MQLPIEADARSAFEQRFGRAPTGVAISPGRVNLIGDHTDYNDGFVLPMAIDRSVAMAFRPTGTGVIRVVSDGETAEYAVDPLTHGHPAWSEYLRGVAWSLPSASGAAGWDAAIASTIPMGAGLSSSAAIEVATALVLDHLAGASTTRIDVAKAAQRAEREWVGMECGIMDQMAVAMALPGHALFIDCRTLASDHVPIPNDTSFVVLDTTTRRQLVESPYNERRASCERVARHLGVSALRDVTSDMLAVHWPELDARDARRARHVVTENQRVLDAVDALRSNDIARFGALMIESHISLREDFESSGPELDSIVEAALASPGCLGARVTGAGFAGCAIAAVQATALDEFIGAAGSRYLAGTGLTADIYPCQPSAAARIV